jgi:hypothetical protein
LRILRPRITVQAYGASLTYQPAQAPPSIPYVGIMLGVALFALIFLAIYGILQWGKRAPH